MAKDITLLGADYEDVPAVTLPQTGGGTATFTDTSDADATASDILTGKTAYVNGVKLTGTGSGGGGSSAMTLVAEIRTSSGDEAACTANIYKNDYCYYIQGSFAGSLYEDGGYCAVELPQSAQGSILFAAFDELGMLGVPFPVFSANSYGDKAIAIGQGSFDGTYLRLDSLKGALLEDGNAYSGTFSEVFFIDQTQ